MSLRKLTARQVRWARRWMTIVLIGLFIFVIGVEPDLIGMDRSPVVGFVQVGVWLTGLAILLISAYATVTVVRNTRPRSLRADIGLRLIATGYVVAAAASLADFIGLGAHALPEVHFGPIQVIGLASGVLISLLGVLLYWPSQEKTRDDEQPRRRIHLKLPKLRGRKAEAETLSEDTTRPDLDA